MYYNYLYLIK